MVKLIAHTGYFVNDTITIKLYFKIQIKYFIFIVIKKIVKKFNSRENDLKH